MQIEKSIILIDKPSGPTSFEVVESVSQIYGVEKAGHSGTLDPKVTGVLLISLGEARKCMPLLTGLNKEYEGEILFHYDIGEENIKKLAKKFTGKIKQMPPVKSAVARKERERTIHKFEMLTVEGRTASFRILCEAGTYIRKLCHDMGKEAGVGAHMKRLRRTKVGSFDISEAATLEIAQKDPHALIIPIEDALKRIGIREISIKRVYEDDFKKGKPITKIYIGKLPEGLRKDENVFFSINRKIIGIGKFLGRTGRIAKVERVIN